jgi:hypothetical protein
MRAVLSFIATAVMYIVALEALGRSLGALVHCPGHNKTLR